MLVLIDIAMAWVPFSRVTGLGWGSRRVVGSRRLSATMSKARANGRVTSATRQTAPLLHRARRAARDLRRASLPPPSASRRLEAMNRPLRRSLLFAAMVGLIALGAQVPALLTLVRLSRAALVPLAGAAVLTLPFLWS